MSTGIAIDVDGWGPTLAVALIGAERAPARQAAGPLAELPQTGDAGGDLLAQIGAVGVYHLAGAGIGPGAFAPIEPFETVGPECPPAAAARFVTLIGSGGSQSGMIEEWCEVAAQGGFRLPPELLPLLEDWRGTHASEAFRQSIAGAELAWLDRACGAAASEPTKGDAMDSSEAAGEGDAEPAIAPAGAASGADWTEGTLAVRREAFANFRERDPEAARKALEGAFKSEKADARAAFLGALDIGLSFADEPFLESCLDDRAGDVRRTAQRLLPYLPGSRFLERMAARATAALRIDEQRHMIVSKKHALAVTLPEEAPDLVRDGVEPSQYAWKRKGAKAQLLEQILRHAPLKAFASHPPKVWIEQALKSEWSDSLLDGFVAAQSRERDLSWRDALISTLREANAGKLAGVKPSGDIRDALARSLAGLPQADWEREVAQMLKAPGLDLLLATMEQGRESYSPFFTAAVFDWLALRVRGGPESTGPLRKGSLISRLGKRADPSEDSEAAAAAIVSRLPDDFDTYLRHQLNHMAETLSLRATIRREFATR